MTQRLKQKLKQIRVWLFSSVPLSINSVIYAAYAVRNKSSRMVRILSIISPCWSVPSPVDDWMRKVPYKNGWLMADRRLFDFLAPLAITPIFPCSLVAWRDNFVCFAIICCSKDDSFTFNEHLSTLRALEGVKNYKIGKSNRAISSSSTSGLSRFSFSNSLKSRYVSTLPVCENTFHVKFNIKTPPFFIRSGNATSNILILSWPGYLHFMINNFY